MMDDAVAFVALSAFVFVAASVAAASVAVAPLIDAASLGGCNPGKNLDLSATRAKMEPGFST